MIRDHPSYDILSFLVDLVDKKEEMVWLCIFDQPTSAPD